MKGVFAVIALCGYLCCVAALPTTTSSIDHGVEFVDTKETTGNQPIIDTGFGFDGPFSNPFNDFFSGFERFIATLNQKVDSIWSQFPFIRNRNSTDDIPDFASFDGFVGIPQIGGIDLGKGNTTSETKIIDGHKVVINETEYHKDSENGSSFFKVRIIDVKPTETNTEEATPTISPLKDKEILENSVENEIQKNNEAIFYQPLEHDFSSASQSLQPNYIYGIDNSELNDLNKVESIEDNSLSFGDVADLSKDTYVNDILARNGATVNPDAEIIEIIPQRSRSPFFYGFQNPR